MFPNPQIAKNFLLDTDFSLDKVIYMKEDSVIIPSASFVDIDIQHNLPFVPLPVGSWSTTSDWSISYDIDTGPLGGNPFTINTALQADNTNITFFTTNNTGSSITVYYRIYAFEPANKNLESPFTSSVGNEFILNTEYNYTKLFDANVLNLSTTITHNLGFVPQVMAWEESSSGLITPVVFADMTSGTVKIVPTASDVSFTFDTGKKLHYRIYADE